MTNRTFSIFFFTQEEPLSGESDDREIFGAVPSLGSFTFTSHGERPSEVLEDLKRFMAQHDFLDRVQFEQIPAKHDKNVKELKDATE